MYITGALLYNIRSFSRFSINFNYPAGWHVLIGDNGGGKSTVIQSIALALIGDRQANSLRLNWNDWLPKNEQIGHIDLQLIGDDLIDIQKLNHNNFINVGLNINRLESYDQIPVLEYNHSQSFNFEDLYSKIWNPAGKLFSAGFGPFRRFKGGASQWDEVFKNTSLKKLAAHLSLFGEEIALSETITWLKNLQFRMLEQKDKENIIIDIMEFINSDGFLPNKVILSRVDSEGVFFRDSKGKEFDIDKLSDGYRSVLSLTLELLRQMVENYGPKIFENIRRGIINIPVTGVVLIDEIDAHLHPTWQTRIGQWFTKYFPNIQFIVTTHSPLVCRACGENGSIWRLAAPGSDQISGEVTGADRERLIYGNVLDAYGTELFGKNVSISKESDQLLNELAELNIKSVFDTITPDEENEREKLQSFFPTHSTKLND